MIFLSCEFCGNKKTANRETTFKCKVCGEMNYYGDKGRMIPRSDRKIELASLENLWAKVVKAKAGYASEYSKQKVQGIQIQIPPEIVLKGNAGLGSVGETGNKLYYFLSNSHLYSVNLRRLFQGHPDLLNIDVARFYLSQCFQLFENIHPTLSADHIFHFD